MRRTLLVAALAAALVVAALPATAAVHEITGSTCNGKGGVEAPGQDPVFDIALALQPTNALRALQATGFIASVDIAAGDGNDVQPVWDFTVPSSKFIAMAGTVTIADFFGAGVDLILDPIPVPDPAFPAHANCKNLN